MYFQLIKIYFYVVFLLFLSPFWKAFLERHSDHLDEEICLSTIERRTGREEVRERVCEGELRPASRIKRERERERD
jgi:hypothetical protein